MILDMGRSKIQINVGDRVHLLTAVETGLRKEPTPSRRRAGAKSEAAVRARCDCSTELLLRPVEFVKGLWKSCGCHMRAASSARAVARNTTHGMAGHPLYQTWVGMMHRCTSPTSPDYPNYGGRGITVHPAWHEPATFLAYLSAELGPRPEGYSLDRIDTDGPYAPGNVRWADASTQRRNQRRSRAGSHQ